MTNYNNSRLIIETSSVGEGSITWRSPSNLAIIKYWGKYGVQLPRNPSISLTLENAYTETTLEYYPKKGVDEGVTLTFFFDDQPNAAFAARVQEYLENLTPIFPFLRQLQLVIRSSNSFPHSSGIASSASSMSALALCLCSLEHEFFGTLDDDEVFRRKASFVARLGSGSACRSIFEIASVWGESGEVEDSSNEYAIPFASEINPVFHSYRDAILIVSRGEKSVSSRAGHELMNNNVYAESRYRQAQQRFHSLLHALKMGEIDTFGRIAEAEAMTLHALMFTSNPPYLLIQPDTIQIIQRLQTFRKDTGHPLYFSLDAGPNPHLLYPASIEAEVKNFIDTDLQQYCQNGQWIQDEVGQGPVQL